jgi:hypothetical protein
MMTEANSRTGRMNGINERSTWWKRAGLKAKADDRVERQSRSNFMVSILCVSGESRSRRFDIC